MLVAEGIRLSFADRAGRSIVALALDRFAPKPGTLVAVTGPSGSGKSTLLYVLAGLLKPDHGTVTCDGTDIAALGEGDRDAWRRHNVGFVFQDFHLIPELSVVANVTLPTTFGGPRIDAARAAALLGRLGVPTGRRSVEELSRGERQRVAIARALAFDPPLILADEPTASLDEDAAADVHRILRELAAEGRTIITVTHDPALVACAADVLRLDHGHRQERLGAAAA